MTTNITEYFDNTELPYFYKDNKLIKFKGFKNNGKAEGFCIIGYLDNDGDYYYEEVIFIDNIKNGPYKLYNDRGSLWKEGIYIDDLKNGPYKIYWYDGDNISEGIYNTD